jgi:hypothetical protein
MTIKEAIAVQTLFGDVPEIILAMAYDKSGKPLIKPIKLLLKQAAKKEKQYPKYFKK